jgi:hypothetical protein
VVAVKVRSFGGIAPKLNPRYLPESRSVTALNLDATRQGALTPINDYDSGVGLSFDMIQSGTVKTLFRYNEDYVQDNQFYWLASKNDVHFCRAQITGDTNEVVYFTDDDNSSLKPRFFFTNNVRPSPDTPPHLGIAGLTQSYDLGVPKPTIAPSTTYTPPAELDGLTREFRSYTFTYVWSFAGREMESAPAPASQAQEFYLDGGTNIVVNFNGQNHVPAPHMNSNDVKIRVYRAISGSFFFIGETSVTSSSFTDTVKPDDAGEELPSLTWDVPPADLKGLTNMANGIIAGFSGRDVYFCEPYIPHAWPVNYAVTLDSPVVALVSLDTTLVALTNERPYFIQGSHPELMTVVEADIAQGCSSPRSAKALNGEVYFVSPDGLIAVSPRGSRIVTEKLFSYKQWNETVAPDSIHGAVHDLKYFGFVENGVASQNSFIYDIPTGEFVITNQRPTAAFTDLRFDQMYVVDEGAGTNPVRRWGKGGPLQYEWQSKVFSFPSEVSFSMIQVEAETYGRDGTPLVCQIYADETLLHTITVTRRGLYRLPSILARDWYIRITGKDEIFNVALAQSGAELASV